MTEYEKCKGCGKWTNLKEIDTFYDDPLISLCRLCSMAKREAEDPPKALLKTVPTDPLKLPAEKKVQEKRKKKGAA
jgi:hypothetical protein